MKFLFKTIKGLLIGVIAVFLVTVGIDAADNYDNLSESIFGRLVFGEAEGPCPEDMIFISTDDGNFCIDKYEASPGPGCDFQSIANQSETRVNLNKSGCAPASVIGAAPWIYISQSQAAAACAKAGKRLVSNKEWYAASLGTPDLHNNWGREDCNVNKNWTEQPGLTGSGKNCISSFGAYDMIGNVWEWVKEEINDGNYNNIKLPESGYIKAVNIDGIPLETDEAVSDPNFNDDYLWVKDQGVRGVARGGYWDNKSDAGFYSMFLASSPSYAGVGVGFRCVK